jgi:hypothetical protein
MDDRLGMMNFSNWLVMHFNVLFGGLLMSNVYGRVVVFLNWLSMLNLLDVLGFFNVDWFFMVDVVFLFFRWFLVMGLSNMDWFYVGNLNLVNSLLVLHLINNVDLAFSMFFLRLLMYGIVLFLGIVQVNMDVLVLVVNAWFSKW